MSLTDFPRVELPEARHQQVRQLLVREASAAERRRRGVRRAAPVAVAAAVAGAVAVVALGPGWDRFAAVGPASPGAPTCETGNVPGSPADAEGLRYLADPPAGMLLEVSFANLQPDCAPELESDLEAGLTFARTAPDGTVEAALTVWNRYDRGDFGSGGEDVTVHDLPGRLLETDHVEVMWVEAGRTVGVTASGVSRAQVLAVVETVRVTSDGVTTDEPPGLPALRGWTPYEERPVEPIWHVSYREPGVPRADGDDGLMAVTLSVERDRMPWQAWVSTIAPGGRIVDVAGVPGLLVANGNHGGILEWEPAPGVRAGLMGSTDGTPDSLVPFAESLEHVDVDDPRLALPATHRDPG